MLPSVTPAIGSIFNHPRAELKRLYDGYGTDIVSRTGLRERIRNHLEKNDRYKFLDLCCAPGGISRALMKDAQKGLIGFGMTLPENCGGVPMFMQGLRDGELAPGTAYKVTFGDLLEMVSPEQRKLLIGAPKTDCYDLVVADGSLLETKDTVTNKFQRILHCQALTAVQIFLALHFLAEGGSLLVRTNIRTDSVNIRLVVMLKDLFEN